MLSNIQYILHTLCFYRIYPKCCNEQSVEYKVLKDREKKKLKKQQTQNVMYK